MFFILVTSTIPQLRTYLFLHSRQLLYLDKQSSTVKPVMNGSTENADGVNFKRLRPAPVPLGLYADVKPGVVFHCMRSSPAVCMRLAASE